MLIYDPNYILTAHISLFYPRSGQLLLRPSQYDTLGRKNKEMPTIMFFKLLEFLHHWSPSCPLSSKHPALLKEVPFFFPFSLRFTDKQLFEYIHLYKTILVPPQIRGR